jgi:hypothetical protein
VSPSRRSNLRRSSFSRGNETTPFRFRPKKDWNNNTLFPDLKKKTMRKIPKIKMLFSKKTQLKEDTFYEIKIQKNRKNNHIYLIAQNASSQVRNDDYYIDLPKKEAKSVKKIFNNDYDSMVDSIRIQDNKLVLLNPHYVDDKSRNGEQLEEAEDANKVVNNTIN